MKISWGRGLAALIAASSLVLGSSVAAAAAPHPTATGVVAVGAAQQAQTPVSIKRIPTKTVKGSARATIKPLVAKKASVQVTSKVLTVKQGKKIVAKNKRSVALKSGTYKVTTTVKYKVSGKKGTKTLAKAQRLVVKKATRVYGNGGYDCPAGYPVKGNDSSMIYHVPRGSFYSRTKPEECFSSESAARAAGYRASKR